VLLLIINVRTAKDKKSDEAPAKEV
jgi:hypothetical protein